VHAIIEMSEDRGRADGAAAQDARS
jgi:hypothetical protein